MYQETPEELRPDENVSAPEPEPVEEDAAVQTTAEEETATEPETAPETEEMPEVETTPEDVETAAEEVETAVEAVQNDGEAVAESPQEDETQIPVESKPESAIEETEPETTEEIGSVIAIEPETAEEIESGIAIEPETTEEAESEMPVEPEPEKEVPAEIVVEEEIILFSEGDIPDEDEEDVFGGEYSTEERRAMLERMEETMTSLKDGELIMGKILRIGDDEIVVDIGFKSEGIVSKSEFNEEIEVGDEIEVFLEQLEDENGQVVVSKRKADFMKVWRDIREAYENGTMMAGVVKRRIKGGMVVDMMGVDAFLPGSQIALRQVPDFDALIGEKMEFRVIKLNKMRRNIVVSRRVVLEEERSSRRGKLLNEIEEGQIREGVVKNITDFGAFIDLGGLDGLLHITDMSWSRIKHPTEILKNNDVLNVKILKFDREKERISLGLKQLTESPWVKVDERFPEASRIRGKVVNITKYGAFVELAKGIEGLVHVSEMSWTKHINHPSEIVALGDEIDVIVLNVDKDNQKISLGVKQLKPDPWTLLATKSPPGSHLRGKVRNLTSFGAFVEIEEGIDGLVHISDMSWTKRIMHPSEIIHKGDEVNVVVLNIDSDNHRVSLGLKQLEKDPWPELEGRYSVGRETEGRIVRLTDRGVTVKLPDEVEGFVPVTQLGKELNRPQEAFSEGDLLPLKVIEFDIAEHRIVLSVNAFFESKEDSDLDSFLTAHPTQTVTLREALGEAFEGFAEEEAGVIPEESAESEGETEAVEPEAEVEAETAEPEVEVEIEIEPDKVEEEIPAEPEAEAEVEIEVVEPEVEVEPEIELEKVEEEIPAEPEAEVEVEAVEPEVEVEPEIEPEKAEKELPAKPEAEVEAAEPEVEAVETEIEEEPEIETEKIEEEIPVEPEAEPEVEAEAAEPEVEVEPEIEPEKAEPEAEVEVAEPEAESEVEEEPEIEPEEEKEPESEDS